MNEQTQGFNTEFNGERMKAAIERHQGREREVVEPGDVGAATMYAETDPGFSPSTTVQTDADINP